MWSFGINVKMNALTRRKSNMTKIVGRRTMYLYCRVSSEDQLHGFGLDAQATAVEAFARSLYLHPLYRDYDICLPAFREEAVSAWSVPLFARPTWKIINSRLEEGDCVVFARLDRTFRSLKDITTSLPILEKRGIRYAFGDVDLNMHSASGKLNLHVLAAIAQFTSDRTSEATKAGLAARKARGKPAYGTDPVGVVNKNGQYLPNFEELALLRLTRIWHDLGGLTWRQVSDKLEGLLASREYRQPYPEQEKNFGKGPSRKYSHKRLQQWAKENRYERLMEHYRQTGVIYEKEMRLRYGNES
jgi:DNA invertase Pin-like site-specific DNA recombinase